MRNDVRDISFSKNRRILFIRNANPKLHAFGWWGTYQTTFSTLEGTVGKMVKAETL